MFTSFFEIMCDEGLSKKAQFVAVLKIGSPILSGDIFYRFNN